MNIFLTFCGGNACEATHFETFNADYIIVVIPDAALTLYL